MDTLRGFKRFRLAFSTVLAAGAIVLSLSAFSYWSLGSVEAGVFYLKGNRVFLDQRTKDLGLVDAGSHQVEFRVRNFSARPVQILGAKTTCTCIVAEDLPLTIEPSDSLSFKVRVRIDDRLGDHYSQTMQVITDRGVEPNLAVTVLATVRPRDPK